MLWGQCGHPTCPCALHLEPQAQPQRYHHRFTTTITFNLHFGKAGKAGKAAQHLATSLPHHQDIVPVLLRQSAIGPQVSTAQTRGYLQPCLVAAIESRIRPYGSYCCRSFPKSASDFAAPPSQVKATLSTLPRPRWWLRPDASLFNTNPHQATTVVHSLCLDSLREVDKERPLRRYGVTQSEPLPPFDSCLNYMS